MLWIRILTTPLTITPKTRCLPLLVRIQLQVVSVTTVDGGNTCNDLIPDSAVIAGTFRAYSKQSFYGLRTRIEEVTFLIPVGINFQ